MSELVEAAYDEGRFVFIFGNGGSGANASHLCEDLAKCTLRDFENQKRLKVLSLTDNTAGIMAWANDEGYDRIFVEQLKNLASPGDLLLAISGSGNSPNILKAVAWANDHGLTTVGITGFSGGKLKTLAHYNLHAAIDDMGIVESLHQVVFHWIIDDLYRRFSAKEAVLERGRSQLADRMAESWVLGIEIGGTKLQLGIGQGQGSILALERLRVDPSRGAAGSSTRSRPRSRPCSTKAESRQRPDQGRRHRLRRTGRRRRADGPKSLIQVAGWDDFPLAAWISEHLEVPRGRPRKRRGYRRPGRGPLRRGRRLFAAPLYDCRQRNRRRLIVDRSNLSRASARVRPRSDTCGARQSRSSDAAWLELEQVASGWAIASAAQDLGRRKIQQGRDDWPVLTTSPRRPRARSPRPWSPRPPRRRSRLSGDPRSRPQPPSRSP